MNKILKLIYWLLGVQCRKFISPIIYWALRLTVYKGSLPKMWKDSKKLPMYNFQKLLSQYKYKPDLFGGAIDMTLEEPDFFFDNNRKYFRDCDDFSQMWFSWTTENHITSWLMIVIDGWKFWRSHMYVIIQSNNKDEGYILVTPYEIHKGYPDVESAMIQFKLQDLLDGGKYKNPIHLEYKNNFEKFNGR